MCPHADATGARAAGEVSWTQRREPSYARSEAPVAAVGQRCSKRDPSLPRVTAAAAALVVLICQSIRPFVPAKAGTQFLALGPWIPAISAFTRVFHALCAGMSGVFLRGADLNSRAASARHARDPTV